MGVHSRVQQGTAAGSVEHQLRENKRARAALQPSEPFLLRWSSRARRRRCLQSTRRCLARKPPSSPASSASSPRDAWAACWAAWASACQARVRLRRRALRQRALRQCIFTRLARCELLTRAPGFCIMMFFAWLYTKFDLFLNPGFLASFNAVRCAQLAPLRCHTLWLTAAQPLRARYGVEGRVQDLGTCACGPQVWQQGGVAHPLLSGGACTTSGACFTRSNAYMYGRRLQACCSRCSARPFS